MEISRRAVLAILMAFATGALPARAADLC